MVIGGQSLKSLEGYNSALMTTIFATSAVDRRPDTRLRASWKPKESLLKKSSLFNKVQHSEEWHIGINATAGVLHPSDPKFPLDTLRTHTEVYLKKKGKINQIDIDSRLSKLVDTHDIKDIAVAAVAHAITAKSLRSLLQVHLHVAQGSHRGLKTWLQCLIAANSGNPASITDLEALWARKLLPFATEGPRAAEWYLVGMSRALRETAIPNLPAMLPDFSTLMTKAIKDYSTHLQWLSLTCQWATAYEATIWLSELAKTSPRVASPGHTLPEQILDMRYPSWRLWAKWRPDVERIKRHAHIDQETMAILPDILALEGPDVLSGTKETLRKGLIAQYGGEKCYLNYRGLVLYVPEQNGAALGKLLEHLSTITDGMCSGKVQDTDHKGRLALFHNLLVARPISREALDLFSASSEIPQVSGVENYAAIAHVFSNRDCLGGEDRSPLEALLRVFEHPQSQPLRAILCQPWLFSGIDKCLRECRHAVQAQILNCLPWMTMALELHSFLNSLRESKDTIALKDDILEDFKHLPSIEIMQIVATIDEATKLQQQQRRSRRPPEGDKVGKGQSAQAYPTGELAKKLNLLEDATKAFCIDGLLQRGTIDEGSQRIMTLMLQVWQKSFEPTIDAQRRELSIFVSQSTQDVSLCCKCLKEIASACSTESGVFMKDLANILKQLEIDSSKAIVDLINLLGVQTIEVSCWRDLLYSWLKEEASDNTLLGYSVRTMKTTAWLQFMNNVERLFSGVQLIDKSDPRFVPSVLRPQLLAWKSQVSQFSETLTRLEAVLGDNEQPLRCILKCGAWGKNILSILECLKKVQGEDAELLMQRVVGKLSTTSTNDWPIRDCCLQLAVAAPESIKACYQIWDAHNGSIHISELTVAGGANVGASPTQQQKRPVPPAVVEVMVAGWIQDENLEEKKKMAIQSFAEILGIEVHHVSVPHQTLNEAMIFWQSIESEIVEEASRLELLQKSLMEKDPKGTALLLESLGLQSAFLDTEILNLPAGAADMIEKVDDLEVEISFPLSKYTELQRSAMGIPTEAKAVVIRVFVDYGKRMLPPRFCTHFDSDAGLESLEHSAWICEKDSRPPITHICKSTQTAYLWQLNRILHMQLRDGDLSLAELYERVQKRIADMSRGCVVCGTSHKAENAQLRRATPCSVVACVKLWHLLPLEVRIPELRTDTFAVDAMLMAVYAAAASGNTDLLVGCPIRGSERVRAVLDSLPKLAIIRDAVHVSRVLKRYHEDAEKLISWACVHYRGYITTASGLCRIPNLPTIHQFVLANASPKLESEFVSKFPFKDAKSKVLFHGTSFNRLPAILSQGLRVCSGTPLQRTGAAHGSGIYLAEEPASALSYAPATLSWRNSSLTNTKLLLGCEVVGEGRTVIPGIHVITDEASVMVRYLFLVPHQKSVPIAGHIVPAMASAMSALRKGVV